MHLVGSYFTIILQCTVQADIKKIQTNGNIIGRNGKRDVGNETWHFKGLCHNVINMSVKTSLES